LIIDKKAVNVLVDPVGDDTKTFFLYAISLIPYNCGIENSLNLEKNHFFTSGLRIELTSLVESGLFLNETIPKRKTSEYLFIS
jgi:hypothetical protein